MTSHLRAFQREELLARPHFAKLKPIEKALLSSMLSSFQEETRVKKGAVELVFIPSESIYHNIPIKQCKPSYLIPTSARVLKS